MSFTSEQLIEFLKKNPVSIGCGVLSLVLLGVSYFRSDLPAQLAAEYEQKSTEAARLALNRKNSDQIKEHLDSLLAAEKLIEARLIHPKDLTANSQYFYQLESDTGVKLTDSRPTGGTPKKDAKAYSTNPYQVSVQGDYTQILNFLQHLENGRHFCRVMNVSLNPSGVERGGVLNLSLSIELLGFPVQ